MSCGVVRCSSLGACISERLAVAVGPAASSCASLLPSSAALCLLGSSVCLGCLRICLLAMSCFPCYHMQACGWAGSTWRWRSRSWHRRCRSELFHVLAEPSRPMPCASVACYSSVPAWHTRCPSVFCVFSPPPGHRRCRSELCTGQEPVCSLLTALKRASHIGMSRQASLLRIAEQLLIVLPVCCGAQVGPRLCGVTGFCK